MRLSKKVFLSLILISSFIFSCKTEKKSQPLPVVSETIQKTDTLAYAQGFTIKKSGVITEIKVLSPWPNTEHSFTYALIPREKAATITLDRDAYDAIVLTPVERVVVTSTTHIPILEFLGVETKLVGFPSTNYISSEKTRALVDSGEVKELGKNEKINLELLIDMQPELVIGFSINNINPTYESIMKAGIPVVYNGDWTEQTPLGRAEWVKFFAPFFNKEKEAKEVFTNIVSNYNQAKFLAKKAKNKPTVMSGVMFKDIWYLPAGESFKAQYLIDANADYLWKDSKGTGSLSLSLESVLDKGHNADVWISPGRFKTYEDMAEADKNYTQFAPYKNKKIFGFGATTGKTGGLLYYELAPTRPDIVLKDIIKCLHPQLLPEYTPFFFKPLE